MSLPGPGTSPCTTATVAVPVLGLVQGSATDAPTPATIVPRAPSATSRSRPGATTSAARAAPAAASRKVTPAMPTYGRVAATGVSTTAKPSRPQGIPLKGQPLRQISTVTHDVATHSGHSGSRETSATALPSRP